MAGKKVVPKRCFVVSPIGQPRSQARKHADLVLNYIVRPVIQDRFGYRVWRGDESADPGMITDDVINALLSVDLVVADLSFLNPNVFYELALRHYCEKPVIHIASEETVLPFDSSGQRVIRFDLSDWHSQEKARVELASALQATEAPDYEVSNPVAQAMARKNGTKQSELIRAMNEGLRLLEEHFLAAGTDEAHPPSNGRAAQVMAVVGELRMKLQGELARGELDPELQDTKEIARRLGRIEHALRGGAPLH